jgi:hypothetical protein
MGTTAKEVSKISLATYVSSWLAGIFLRSPTWMVKSSPLAISRVSVEMEAQSQSAVSRSDRNGGTGCCSSLGSSG